MTVYKVKSKSKLVPNPSYDVLYINIFIIKRYMEKFPLNMLTKFAPLAVPLQVGCSAFPFYTPTKPSILLYLKYKTVLIPKLKNIVFYILDIDNYNIKCKYKQ